MNVYRKQRVKIPECTIGLNTDTAIFLRESLHALVAIIPVPFNIVSGNSLPVGDFFTKKPFPQDNFYKFNTPYKLKKLCFLNILISQTTHLSLPISNCTTTII